MSEMPARMMTEWVKEEILDAVSERFCDNCRKGLTLAEENAWRKQQRRIVKFLGLSTDQVTPKGSQQ